MSNDHVDASTASRDASWTASQSGLAATLSELLHPLVDRGALVVSVGAAGVGSRPTVAVVAEGGVFVVSVVDWRGRVEVADGDLRLDGVTCGELSSVVESAHRLERLVDGQWPPDGRLAVEGVVVLAGPAQVGGWVAAAGGHAVDAGWIVEFVDRHDPQLGVSRRDAVAAAIRSASPTTEPSGTREVPMVIWMSEPTAPPEPVIYLRRIAGDRGEWYEVRDEEANLGGTIDIPDGAVTAVVPSAARILARLSERFVNGESARAGSGPRRERLGRRAGRMRPVIVCLCGPEPVSSRLYGFRLDEHGRCEDLGWIDRRDGRVVEVADGVADTLRYCATHLMSFDQPR